MNEPKPIQRLVACLCAALAVVSLTACSDAGIKAAKNEPYPRHNTTTFSKVLDNYQWCNNKKWERKEMKTGEKHVEFTCTATEPNVKAKISEYLAELETQDQQARVRTQEGDAVFMKNVRDHAYSKQLGAVQDVALVEERLEKFDAGLPYQGRSRAEILYELQLSRDRLASFKTPEYMAAAEAQVQQEKARRDEEIAEQLRGQGDRAAQRQQALTDGTIQILFQWELTQSGGVGRNGIAVNFDFGGRPYSVDGQDGLREALLASIYQDQPITNGLREVLNQDGIFNAPDGVILYHLSRKSMGPKSRS